MIILTVVGKKPNAIGKLSTAVELQCRWSMNLPTEGTAFRRVGGRSVFPQLHFIMLFHVLPCKIDLFFDISSLMSNANLSNACKKVIFIKFKLLKKATFALDSIFMGFNVELLIWIKFNNFKIKFHAIIHF